VNISLKDTGTEVEVKVEMRVEGETDWEMSFANTSTSGRLTFEDGNSNKVELGNLLNGFIHSFEILTHQGEVTIDKERLLSTKELMHDLN
jgi:hypothetical protein